MAAPVRVCHVVATFDPVMGGTQTATRQLCGMLRATGTDVVILTRKLPGTRSLDSIADVSVYRAGVGLPGKIGSVAFMAHAFWILATKLRGYRLVHVQNIDSPLLLGLASKVLLRRKLVTTIHAGWVVKAKERTLLGRLRLWLMRSLTDAFTAVSSDTARILRANSIRSLCISIIPNGVDLSHYRPATSEERKRAREHLALPESSVVFLYVGRLVPIKQLDILLRAWAGLPAVERHLVLVGDGPDRRLLEEVSRELHLPNIRFEGYRTDVLRYLQAADIVVLPSSHEGLSVSLLEAAAVGLPLLVSDIEANREIVRNGINGLLFESGKIESLLAQMETLLRSPDLRQAFGAASHRAAKESYALEAVAQAHCDFYGQVLLGPQDPSLQTTLSR